MNVFVATGRVGRDPALRKAGNSDVLAIALAVDSGYGDKKQTLWFDCSLWGARAVSLAPHIEKGQELAVSGELSTAEKDGKVYLKLRCNDVTLIGGKRESKPAAKPSSAPRQAKTGDDFEDESVPF